MSSPRPNGPRDVVLVDLPSVNPFGDQDTRPTSRSQGGSIGRRGGASASASTRRAREEDEDEGAVSDGGMVMLSSHNPFPEAAPKPSHSHGGFQAPRKSAARPNTNHKDREENSENLTVLSFNPFGQDDGEDQGEDTRKDDHRRGQASHQSRPISRDHGGSIGRRGGAPRSISHARDEEQEEEEAASDGGGVVLSSRNPFPDATPKTGRTHTGPRSMGKSAARPPTSSKNREENPENLTVLSFNPFAQDDDGEDQEEDTREEDHRRGRASHQAPRRSRRPSATVLSDVASEEEVPRPRKATATKPVPRLSVRPPSPPTTRSPSVRSGASPSKHTSAAGSARPRTNSRSHVNTQRPAEVPGQRERDSARARTSRPKPKTTRSGTPELDDHLLVSWEDNKRSDETLVGVRDDHHQARGSQSRQRDTEYSSDASSRTYTEETFSDVESVERAPPPVTNRSSTRSSANPTHSSSKSPAVAPRYAPSSVNGARVRISSRREKDGLVSHDEPAHDKRGKHRGASQPLERRDVDLRFGPTPEDSYAEASYDEESVGYSRPATGKTRPSVLPSPPSIPSSIAGSVNRLALAPRRRSPIDEPRSRSRDYEERSRYDHQSNYGGSQSGPRPRPQWDDQGYSHGDRDRRAPDVWSDYEHPPHHPCAYRPDPHYRPDPPHRPDQRHRHPDPPLHHPYPRDSYNHEPHHRDPHHQDPYHLDPHSSHPHHYPDERWHPTPPRALSPRPPPRVWAETHSPRRPQGTYGPYLSSFGRPLFDHIPASRSLLEQCRAPYPALSVPPDELLRELRAERERQVKLLPDPSIPPRPNPKDLVIFDDVWPLLKSGDTVGFLTALAHQELNPHYVDQVLQTLTNVVQVRFGERQGDKVINRVHVIPRGRLASATVMAARPKLDVDLVIPGDFVLRRWSPSLTDVSRQPKTAASALGLNSVSIARGEVDATKLDWVLQAVWEQLDGSADGLIFPGGSSEAHNYLPAKWCVRHKADAVGANRLRLVTDEENPVMVNVFVKVAMSVNGQEMVVGVDQSSARSAGKHQMVKNVHGAGMPLSESPLSPVDRSAIIALSWWLLSTKRANTATTPDLATPTIRTCHLLLALSALHDLPATDPLYVPGAKNTSSPLSLVRVLDVMHKILTYLEQAYNPAHAMATAQGADGAVIQYMFPLSSCAVMDALYTQASAKPAKVQRLASSAMLFGGRVQEALDALKPASTQPSLLTKETS